MMETKYLWNVIDLLRNELKDRKEENYTLQLSLLECVNDYEELQEENDILKKACEQYCENNRAIIKDIKALKPTFEKLELVT